jgi:transposase InsO family protein
MGNRCCESFNGKLRDELLNGEIFYSLKEAQILIELRRQEYNTERPHSALGYRPPRPGGGLSPSRRLSFAATSCDVRLSFALVTKDRSGQ